MKKKWTIDSVHLKFEPIAAREFQQRLAEVMDLLLNRTCQFRNSVFSNDNVILQPMVSLNKTFLEGSDIESPIKRTGTNG